MSKRSVPQVLCAALCLAGLPATAMTVTVSPLPPPPGDLILGFDAEGDVGSYLCTHGTGTAVDLGQTFRLPAATVLDKITLKVRALTEQTPGELVTLFFGTYTDPLDDEMNELLAAETRALPMALPVGEVRYLTFDVANLSLEADRQYGYLLGFTGGDHVKLARLDVLHAGDDVYAEGVAVERDGAVITWAREHDLVFFLHDVSEAPAPSEALPLHEGRFRVQVAWRTRLGETGGGHPTVMTEAAGHFWFFSDDNIELVVKVLDACYPPFDRFWVYAAGLTDVEVTLTVTDTVAGAQKVYSNPLGHPFAPIQDTAAFATCDP